MTDHEREICNMFNRFFEDESQKFDGIAHRKKMHRFTSQLCDCLVDSKFPCFYQALECKSIKEKNNNKIYFSQHFSENEEGHQVERISEFIERSGRTGYLVLELKRGRGRPRKGIFLPWEIVRERYEEGAKGIHLDELDERGYELKRDGSEYVVTPSFVAWLQNNQDFSIRSRERVHQ